MRFDPAAYGDEVERILAMDGNGLRLMPLVAEACSSPQAHDALKTYQPRDLFPKAASPAGAMAGLWLYFSCFDEAHYVAQEDSSAEGSFWHGIVHRQEPDSGNAAYWFRKAGAHPVFAELVKESLEIVARHADAEFRPSARWDPFGFVIFCERARQQPGSPSEQAALEIQRAEWQLLFDYCARPKT